MEEAPRSADELLDIVDEQDRVVGRTTRGRGRRMVSTERAIGGSAPVADLTEEDVLAYLLEEIVPFVER